LCRSPARDEIAAATASQPAKAGDLTTPDESQFAQFRSAGATVRTTDDPNAPPALNDAMQQQLGLRIEPVKAMDDVIVIDHADHLSAN
jgi:uncharacterized protein (TIGR03435 family)